MACTDRYGAGVLDNPLRGPWKVSVYNIGLSILRGLNLEKM